MKKLFIVLVAIVLVSSFLVAACSSSPTTTPPATSKAPATTAPATSTTAAPATSTTAKPSTTTAAPAANPPVELKVWSGWATNTWDTRHLTWFIDKYKDQFKAVNITFKHIGGPEVFPNTEGMSAMKKGLFDAAYNTTAYFVGEFPEGDALKLSRLQPWEERTSGFYDYFNKLTQQKLNAYYSWRLTGQGYFCLWLNADRPKPDLAGLKIRTSPVYIPIIKALGGTPLSSNMDEVYTMLERKMIDGYGAPIIGISDRKWELVTKYRWGPTFYSSPSGLWYNLDKWKSLTDAQRKALDDAAMAAEKDTAPMWEEDLKKDWAINEKAGVKIQNFSPDDEKKYLTIAYDEGWKTVLAAVPGMAAARPMMEKK